MIIPIKRFVLLQHKQYIRTNLELQRYFNAYKIFVPFAILYISVSND